MTKIIVSFILGLSIGASALLFRSAPTALVSDKEKLKVIYENDVASYRRLEDAEAKLKKAEEIFEKIMLIFLADVALKISPLKAGTHPTVVQKTPAETIAPAAESEPMIQIEFPSSNPVVGAATPAATAPTTLKVQDSYIRSPYILKLDSKFRRLMGNFTGTLINTNKKKRVDSVILQLDYVEAKEGLDGQFMLQLTDPTGHSYSTNRGSGQNKLVKSDTNDKDTIYLEASPSTFMVLSIKEYPILKGQMHDAYGKLLGTVTLTKEN